MGPDLAAHRREGARRAPRDRGRLLWPLVLALPLLFLLLAVLAGPQSVVALLVERGFAPLCHQIPERSLLMGHPLAVCTRCAGFYTGLALAGAVGAVLGAVGWRRRVPGLVLVAALLPLGVDGGANLIGLWSSPPLLRALIGLLAALPLALILVGYDEAE